MRERAPDLGSLQAFLGPRSPVAISLTSPNDPGSARSYADWATITREIIDARVWEGVHYRHSDLAGVSQGAAVAAHGLRNLASLGI